MLAGAHVQRSGPVGGDERKLALTVGWLSSPTGAPAPKGCRVRKGSVPTDPAPSLASITGVENLNPFESEEERIKAHVQRWLQDITATVDSLREYMSDVTRESKFMVDEFDARVADVAIELSPSSREPVVYEFLTVQCGIASTLLLGRRRIAIPIGITSFAIKMRLYENDRRVLMTGTPEVPGVANTTLFFEMSGHMYPHVSL
jgi:hypothetical protein